MDVAGRNAEFGCQAADRQRGIGQQVHCGAWPSFSLYRGAAYALGAEVNNAASQVYAAEGQCFVVAPCAIVSPAMSELLCTDPGKQQMLCIGGGFARISAVV